MEYRVISVEPGREGEVARFESAYSAVDFTTAAWFAGDARAGHYSS